MMVIIYDDVCYSCSVLILICNVMVRKYMICFRDYMYDYIFYILLCLCKIVFFNCFCFFML